MSPCCNRPTTVFGSFSLLLSIESSSPTFDSSQPGKLVTVIDLLLARDADLLNQVREKLQGLDTEKLCQLAFVSIRQKKRVVAFLVNEALTLRGVPPCFRKLPEPSDDVLQVADLLAIDLDWLGVHHPEHKALMGRWENVTSKKITSRWATIRFICNWQSRDMSKYVKWLALSEAQEWECHYLQREKIRRGRDLIESKREDVAGKLRQRRYARGLRLLTDEELEDFKRWLEVWACANMGAWKSPTRVAWFYTMKTGKPLSRQMAAKLMYKLRRDLPAKSCRL